MEQYWDNRFNLGGKIWGDEPSNSAQYALSLFQKRNIKFILVPGSGYGRNTKLFSENGYCVTGIEISQIAISISKKFDLKTHFIKGSFLNAFDEKLTFDAIFCFNTLHLFMEEDRINFLKVCNKFLKKNSYVYFTVFSEKERSFGKGKKIETNTFETKPGRPVHYFTEKNLKSLFKDFNIINMGLIQEEENHGKQGLHVHVLRYIFAQK